MNPMDTHVKVLAVLHIVLGAFGVLIGLGVFLFFGGLAGIVQLDDDPDAWLAIPVLTWIGGLVLFIMLALSVPAIIAGIGLMSFQPWARILAIVLSVIDLMNIPFGTALGIYGLWVLMSVDGAKLFEQHRTSPVQYSR
jgi:hypothetical protein